MKVAAFGNWRSGVRGFERASWHKLRLGIQLARSTSPKNQRTQQASQVLALNGQIPRRSCSENSRISHYMPSVLYGVHLHLSFGVPTGAMRPNAIFRDEHQ